VNNVIISRISCILLFQIFRVTVQFNNISFSSSVTTLLCLLQNIHSHLDHLSWQSSGSSKLVKYYNHFDRFFRDNWKQHRWIYHKCLDTERYFYNF